MPVLSVAKSKGRRLTRPTKAVNELLNIYNPRPDRGRLQSFCFSSVLQGERRWIPANYLRE